MGSDRWHVQLVYQQNIIKGLLANQSTLRHPVKYVLLYEALQDQSTAVLMTMHIALQYILAVPCNN